MVSFINTSWKLTKGVIMTKFSTNEYHKTIRLNGQPFSITPNLYSALLVLRDNPKPPSLWIDAICLDQNDPFEKDKQLRIMHLIYMNTTRVLVWLGEDDKSVDLPAAAKIISHFRMKNREFPRKVQSIYEKESSADFQM